MLDPFPEKGKCKDQLSNKRVTPITIPRRCRRTPSPLSSPVEKLSSPELIFEMSPISTTARSPTFPFATSPADDQHFMYRIPVFGSLSNRELISTRPSISCKGVMSSRYPTMPAQSISQRVEPYEHEKSGDIVELPAGGHETIVQRPSTTKVTGFFPLKPDQPPASDLLPRLMGRLSPPPRRISDSTYPCFGQKHKEEELSYSNVDPCLFEFQHHLLQRMERKNYFTSLRCACEDH